jgi:hypothetical protein
MQTNILSRQLAAIHTLLTRAMLARPDRNVDPTTDELLDQSEEKLNDLENEIRVPVDAGALPEARRTQVDRLGPLEANPLRANVPEVHAGAERATENGAPGRSRTARR